MPGATCTRCAGPLPVTDGPRVCGRCGTFHEAAMTQARSVWRALGCVVLVVVGPPALITLVGIVLLLQGESPGRYDVDETVLAPTSGDLLVLPGALDDDPGVVTMATPTGGDGRVIALVDLDEGPRWEAEIVPDDVYSAQLAATDDVVLASLGREVVGLDRETGDVRWEGEASDVVSPACPSCFVVVDDTLVALGGDGEITAFDPASGDVRWEHRFTAANGRVVPVGDAVLLVDERPQDPVTAAVSMVLVDPSDGSELSRFTPGCVDEASGSGHSASATLPVIPVPGTDDVVIAYGFAPSCVQRWTVTTGEQRWSRTTDTRLDWYDADDQPWALGDTDLVLAGYDTWLVVGLAEGGVREVPVPADSQAAPTLAVAGDRFVGVAGSTRGTTEWTLVAHDMRSGDEVWTRELGAQHTPAVVGPQSTTTSVLDGTLFAVLPVDDEARLLTIGPPGPRYEVDELHPDTGERHRVGGAPFLPDRTSARIDTVRDGLALVDLDGLFQVVDLRTGEVGAAWGR